MICPALRFFGAAILTSFSMSRPVQNSKTGLGLVLGGQITPARLPQGLSWERPAAVGGRHAGGEDPPVVADRVIARPPGTDSGVWKTLRERCRSVRVVAVVRTSPG